MWMKAELVEIDIDPYWRLRAFSMCANTQRDAFNSLQNSFWFSLNSIQSSAKLRSVLIWVCGTYALMLLHVIPDKNS